MIGYSRELIILFFLCVALINYILLKQKVSVNKILLIEATLVSFFWGIRNYNVGVDTLQYISRYQQHLLRFDIFFEIISITLNYIFCGNITLYLITISFLMNYFLSQAVYNFVSNKNAVWIFYITSLFPYVILSNINVLRQGLGLCLFIYAVSLKVKNNRLSLLFFLLSILSHKMFLPPFILLLIITELKLSFIFCFLIFVLISLIMQSGIFDFISKYTNIWLFQKLLIREESISMNTLLKIGFYSIILLGNMYFSKKSKVLSNKYYYLVNVSLSFFMSASFLSMSPIYFDRYLICNESIIPTMCFLNISSSQISRKNKYILYVVLIALFLAYFLFSTYLNALKTNLIL